MAINWITVLKAAPWKQILAAAPGTARAVDAWWRRSRRAKSGQTAAADPGSSFEQQLEALRQELQSASLVIQSLAGQNAQLARRLDRLRQRMWLLSVTLIALVGALFYLQ